MPGISFTTHTYVRTSPFLAGGRFCNECSVLAHRSALFIRIRRNGMHSCGRRCCPSTADFAPLSSLPLGVGFGWQQCCCASKTTRLPRCLCYRKCMSSRVDFIRVANLSSAQQGKLRHYEITKKSSFEAVAHPRGRGPDCCRWKWRKVEEKKDQGTHVPGVVTWCRMPSP